MSTGDEKVPGAAVLEKAVCDIIDGKDGLRTVRGTVPKQSRVMKELARQEAYVGLTFRGASFRHTSQQTQPGAVLVLYAPTSSAAVPHAVKPFFGDRDGQPYGSLFIMHSLSGRSVMEV
eukprot:gene7626-22718_t